MIPSISSWYFSAAWCYPDWRVCHCLPWYKHQTNQFQWHPHSFGFKNSQWFSSRKVCEHQGECHICQQPWTTKMYACSFRAFQALVQTDQMLAKFYTMLWTVQWPLSSLFLLQVVYHPSSSPLLGLCLLSHLMDLLMCLIQQLSMLMLLILPPLHLLVVQLQILWTPIWNLSL